MQRGRSSVSIRELIDQGALAPGQRLSYMRRDGDLATLTASGELEYGGRRFASPSTAAKAASGGKTMNGWRAWYLKLDEGWRSLAEVREEWHRLPRNP